MALTPGVRLGSYDILTLLGQGGMGEVYRARDTKLGRDVALKILPEAFRSDPDRLARFEREARSLASLNHPNIGAIYGVEEQPGVNALVLELVEGETLAERLKHSSPGTAQRSAVPLSEALSIARQIADALDAAHERGIVHRDLKPANIKITPAGTVKVLDFGLAKTHTDVAAIDLTNGPTLSGGPGDHGMLLGTVPYMSPEQARGQAIDKRADVWAYGCVLYELLAGQRAFRGGTTSDVLAAILERDPDWTALPVGTPPMIRRLLRRCLEKDAKRRLRDIGDARAEIEETITPSALSTVALPHPRTLAPVRVLPWAGMVASALVAATVLVLWAPWRTRPAPPLQRVSVALGADVSLVTRSGAAAILSPDGQTLAFVAQKTGGAQQLYVRRLDQLQATPLVETDGASNPFFSPDGHWIAFFALGRLKKIAVTGGAVVTICAGTLSGAWAEDGTIVFSPAFVGGLARVSSDGGTPVPLTTVGEGELTHRWPQLLPGGKALLYTASNSATSVANANLVVQPLPGGPRKVVQKGASYGRYLPTGHLVFIHDGRLFAVPFDPNRLELTGVAVPVLEGVTAVNSGGPTEAGGAQFALADTGTLVYLPGRSLDLYAAPLVWMDRAGQTSPLGSAPADWSDPQFSLDGRQLAMDINASGNLGVWIYDLLRNALSSLTTSDGSDELGAVWTPDGRRLAFSSTRGKTTTNLYWQRVDGTGEMQRLTESKNQQFAGSWHPNGKFLAFHEANPGTRGDLMILPMEGDEATGWKPGKPTVFLNSRFNEVHPVFSPDGRWLAYVSNESGRPEVYVRPFPGPGGKWPISTDGAAAELVSWSRVRHELLFGSADRHIMVASYTVEGDVFRSDKPRRWSERAYLERSRRSGFTLNPDGERVVMAPVRDQPPEKQDHIVIISNFFDELRRIAPARKR